MRLRVAIVGLAVVGLGIAIYLTTVHYQHVAPVCTSGGCEKVQTSRYAELAGIPVALLGVVGYLVIIAAAALRGLNAATVGVFAALIGVAFSGYLLWAQIGPIGAYCVWCLGNDAVIALVAVLSIVRALREPG